VAPPAKKKEKNESAKPVNYTLYNQKITFDFLKAHLWSAADILRGTLDPADYRQPVMTLLFLKRLNDTFEENADKLIKERKSEKEAYGNKNRHSFFVPPMLDGRFFPQHQLLGPCTSIHGCLSRNDRMAQHKWESSNLRYLWLAVGII
jgi:hypothetical protein